MNNETEIWKDLERFEGYEISTLGRVRSKDKIITQFGHKKNYNRIFPGRILKTQKQNGGYLVVSLSIQGKRIAKTIHRLVAETFLGKANGLDVNHKDGNKLNNKLENLELVTRGENIVHAYQVLKRKHAMQRKVICLETGKIYDSIKEAAKDTNSGYSSVCSNLTGNNKSANNLHFNYYE